MKLSQINDKGQKSQITNEILRSLPEWFGIESSILEYVEAVREKYFLTAEVDGVVAGFISVQKTSEFAGDIFLIGVKRAFHGRGVGTALIGMAEKYLKNKGTKFLSVKTLGPSHNDKNYAKTREFYRKTGFYPLEEFSEIWGEENPCLIMIKCIG